MEVYGPKQRAKSLRWDYTYSNSGGCYPTGYCARKSAEALIERHDTGQAGSVPGISDAYVAKLISSLHKYHDDGHATPEEARECYVQYVLDNKCTIVTSTDTQRRCFGCGEWTDRVLMAGHSARHEHLCEPCDDEDTRRAILMR
jgi:hypothetical protein